MQIRSQKYQAKIFFQFHNFEKFRNLAEIAVNLTIGFRGLPDADTDAD